MLTKVPLNEVNVRPSVTPAYPPSISAHVESHPGSSGEIIVDVCRYGLCIHVITGHKNDLTRKSVCVCTSTTVRRAGIGRRGKYSKQNATVWLLDFTEVFIFTLHSGAITLDSQNSLPPSLSLSHTYKLKKKTTKSALILRIDQGRRSFMKLRTQIVCTFRRNPLTCPWA